MYLRIILCGLYYVTWMYLIPNWRGYRIRSEIVEVDHNGANTNRLVKVPLPEVDRWDAEHDEAGQLRQRRVADSDQASSQVDEQVVTGSKV